MGFQDFYGNEEVVTRVREMLARRRLPHAIILSGPPGAGKYTLAQMMAKAMNCLAPPPGGLADFCGRCANCIRIAQADDLAARFAEAVEAREALRETDRKDTRIFVQTHPDVLIIPPDPPQMMIKVDQVRRVTETIYFRPGEGRERVYIFTDGAFLKEAANALLKVLEEPPEFATLLLLVENPGQLLPTLRSRSILLNLAALAPAAIEEYLAGRRPRWSAGQRALVARLSGGAVGAALAFDLERYSAARQDALTLLTTAARSEEHSALFKVTEGYRSGAEGKEKTDALLRAFCSLLEDLLFLKSGTPELVRNRDLAAALARLAEAVDFPWIAAAALRADEVQAGLRRNLLRSLSLDALVAALERG
ncbi:MAG TPA: DNA polymerase III subunit delta' [Terriglobales bacterium]|nr:DNA polymerase III subunit delta' [Terriglobales bacterium]